MAELLALFKDSSPTLVFLAILAYFLKVFIEKRLQGIAGQVEELGKTSLAVKKELRGEERGELVALRVAAEKWEYFLQTALTDYSMIAASDAKVTTLYEKDRDLFLDVKVAVVKASIYLRDEPLEKQLMDSILKIRVAYYPIINDTLPQLIDLQTKLVVIEDKLNKFQKSGMQDASVAPTEKDREENLKLQTMMTAEIKRASEKILTQYPNIAQQLHELKKSINQYIYRPIQHTAIDKD